jgi:hypothetical protein
LTTARKTSLTHPRSAKSRPLECDLRRAPRPRRFRFPKPPPRALRKTGLPHAGEARPCAQAGGVHHPPRPRSESTTGLPTRCSKEASNLVLGTQPFVGCGDRLLAPGDVGMLASQRPRRGGCKRCRRRHVSANPNGTPCPFWISKTRKFRFAHHVGALLVLNPKSNRV